jgi:hypothetical protein
MELQEQNAGKNGRGLAHLPGMALHQEFERRRVERRGSKGSRGKGCRGFVLLGRRAGLIGGNGLQGMFQKSQVVLLSFQSCAK